MLFFRKYNFMKIEPAWKGTGTLSEPISQHLIFLSIFMYSGRGKFMPLPLKSKILETPGFLVTDYIKLFPL
jgi:hypothetical protein